MNIADFVWSIVGIISFLLFLIFHKRLRPTPFWGKLHPTDAWAIPQIAFAGAITGSIIHSWTQGKQADFSALLSAVVYTTTAIIMTILAHRAKSSTPKENQSDDIDQQITKSSSKCCND